MNHPKTRPSPLSCDVIRPGSAAEHLVFDGLLVRLGSASHCEVRLPRDHALDEEVHVRRTARGLEAEALHPRPQVRLDGAPLTRSMLVDGATIAVGATAVRWRSVGGTVGLPTPPRRRSLVVLLGAATLGLAAVAATSLAGPSGEAEAQHEAPSLWDAALSECPQRGADAIEYARERQAVAESKRERRPFHAGDGVAAVTLYEVAAACFEAGGDGSSARLAREAARRLRQETERSLRTHRVRLDHALRVGDLAGARRETRLLLELCGHREGPFVEHVRALDRTLRQQMGREGSS